MTSILDLVFWAEVLCAVLCGGCIGLERQLRGKPIGIRTSILICLGTLAFVTLGRKLDGPSDPTRVLGQVVTGVGFLGAGLIMNRQGLVTGVTSAAVVWVLAAIGCAIGLRSFDMAAVLTLVTLSVLIGVQKVEDMFRTLQKGVHKEPRDQSLES